MDRTECDRCSEYLTDCDCTGQQLEAFAAEHGPVCGICEAPGEPVSAGVIRCPSHRAD